MPAHGERKNDLLQITAFLNQIFKRIAVGNPDDILFDDGAIVEDFGDVMAGGADEFNAAFESLMMRFAAHEGGQERMMDINDVVGRKLPNEIGREHLHVTREDD